MRVRVCGWGVRGCIGRGRRRKGRRHFFFKLLILKPTAEAHQLPSWSTSSCTSSMTDAAPTSQPTFGVPPRWRLAVLLHAASRIFRRLARRGGRNKTNPTKSRITSLAWSNIPLKSQCDPLLPSMLMRLGSRSSLEGSMNQVGEQGFSRQNIVAAFPEGWMSSGQILRGGTFRRPL